MKPIGSPEILVGSRRPKASKRTARFLGWCLLAVLWACGAKEEKPAGDPAQPPAVAFVELAPQDPEVIVGGSLRLEAYPTDRLGEDLGDRPMSWTSDDEAVAKVDHLGLVEGIAEGETTLRVEVEGVRAWTRLLVLPAPLGRVALVPDVLELIEGQSATLEARALDVWGAEFPSPVFVWSSSALEIATVDEDGLVQALRPGGATIVARLEGNDEIQGSASVLVHRTPIEGVVPAQTSVELFTGRTFQLEATAIDAAGAPIPDTAIVWLSSASAVASVDGDGLLRAWKPGTAEISAIAGAITATVEVRVLAMSIVQIELSPAEASVVAGDTLSFAAIAIGADEEPVFGRAFEWSSSDEELATVDKSGLVTALREGEVGITASLDGASATALLEVTRRPPELGSLVLTPSSTWLLEDDTILLVPTALDPEGEPIEGLRFEWSSSDESVATVDSEGLVRGASPGQVEITASYGSTWASSRIDVFERPVVEEVVISLLYPTLILGETRPAMARAYGADGAAINGWPISWASSDEAVAKVSDGTIEAVGPGAATLTASVLGISGQAEISVVQLRFQQVAAGDGGSYGLTPDGRIFRWGYGAPSGQYRSSVPGLVTTELRFRQLAAGAGHLCAVAEDGGAHCVGRGSSGQLGDGQKANSAHAFVPVAGGHLFRQLSAGATYTCGVTTSDRGYCWGQGVGSWDMEAMNWSPVPHEVDGSLRFDSLHASIDPKNSTSSVDCGVTRDRLGYCWGVNYAGELGNGTREAELLPSLVSGAHRFSSIAATTTQLVQGSPVPPDFEVTFGSIGHGCGVTTENEGLCWGSNLSGELGTGDLVDSLVPRPVSGGEYFLQIAVQAREDGSFSCAITTENAALCWGANDSYQLGNGSQLPSNVPVPVAGELEFSSIALGPNHACALTPEGLLYCWGDNDFGALGVGVADRYVRIPTLVLGQLPAPQPGGEDSE